MRTLLRPLRLGLPALAVVALTLGGCSDPATPSTPEPSPAAPTTQAPATPAPTGGVDPGASTAGSDGLTVRHLDQGTVKTVRVEDFRR